MEKFVVSARKYRPATFQSVVGQQHITSTLQNAIIKNQLSHAYLFCGPRGVGKTTCARIIAKAINCLSPTAENEACGECESCRAFMTNSSFNIYELDAASNNSVDNIRALTEQVRIPPQVGKYSIYIIDEVHMLTTAAFNAFLKTLEEPPAYVIFILATTEKHKILPTILSRCQIYEFKHIGVEDVVGYLKYISNKENVTFDEESLYVIAQKADGCMRDALSMFDKVVTFCGSNLIIGDVAKALNILDYDTYFSFVDKLFAGDYQQTLLTFDNVLSRGFDSQTFISGLNKHLRDVLVARSGSTINILGVTGTLANRYAHQASDLPLAFIFKSIEILTTAESSLKYALNQRLTTEVALLKICELNNVLLQSYISTSTSATTSATTQETTTTSTSTTTNVTKDSEQEVEKNIEVKKEPEILPKSEDIKESIVDKPLDDKKYIPSPKSTKKGAIGKLLPRLNTIVNKEVEVNIVKENDIDSYQVDSFKISDEQKDIIIKGCSDFATKIMDRQPRIAIAFSSVKIVDGDLIIPVPNSILEEEINQKKSQTLNYLSKSIGLPIYNFKIEVEQHVVEEKKILIRDEDKYLHLLEENPALHDLSVALDLNFK